jgi:hypothetical protein
MICQEMAVGFNLQKSVDHSLIERRKCWSKVKAVMGFVQASMFPVESPTGLQFIELCFLLQKVRASMGKMRGKIMIRGHIIDLQVSEAVVSTLLCSM